jgi:hypothetical protein
MAKFAPIESIDELPPGVAPCRDDRCPVVGLHVQHQLWGAGRPPKACPNCGRPVHAEGVLRICSATCGWSRTVRATSPTSPKTEDKP